MKRNIATAVIFAASLFVIALLGVTGKVRLYSESENRLLGQMPELNAETLLSGTFMSDYEKFVTDQFAFRDSWIGLKTVTEAAMLKKEIGGVLLGRSGQLFDVFTPESVDTEQLKKNESRLIEFAEKYASMLGEDRVKVMLVPTASDVLSDRLPMFAEVFRQKDVIERVGQELPDGMLIDVYGALSEHADEYIYYRTDHHWTTLGAYYAYVQWAEQCGLSAADYRDYLTAVTDDFRGTVHSRIGLDFTEPDIIEVYEPQVSYNVEHSMNGEILDTLFDMEKLSGKDKYAVFFGGNNTLNKITTQNNTGRRLLMVKDSYANCFAPYLLEHFDEIYLADMRNINIPLEEFIVQNEITDILALYNVKSFVSEPTIFKLLG